MQNQGLSIGYIENKRINTDLDSLIISPQIEKYLQLSDNILLTDYLRFCLVRLDSKSKPCIIKEVRICELSQIKTTLKSKSILESKNKELLELFTLFFTHSPKPINTALEFANALSLRTKILKDELLQSKQNENIKSLFDTFKEVLYKELDFRDFADSFAQTLTYSLFLAKLNNTTGGEIDLFNAKKFIPKSFPLIRSISGFLDNLEELKSIEWLLKEILQIINHINITNLTKELNQISQKDTLGHTHKDPYLHFYETFLSSYDPRLRELRGVYYTPASVVSFIINAIDSILKKDFNKKGLVSAMDDDNITLLDFATGTGTFLLEAFYKALQNLPKDTPKYKPKALINKFYGFEFLIAPYVIAHLKISQSFKEEFNSPLNENESLNIMLTNTLYFQSQKDEQNKQSNIFTGGIVELAEEFKKAQTIKESDILIITGNPPYSGASSNKGLYEKEIHQAYKAPMEKPNNPMVIMRNNKIEKEKTSKWLLDDYVKFIRFAESKIENQANGIFAFISNNSFLDNSTFRGMRYHLMQSFDTLYILDLHGNARKKEQSPDGSKDENVFDIMQGVSINIFVKSKKTNTATHCQIYHYDLYGKRKDKYNFLYENSLDSIPWQVLNPKLPFYLFIPQNENLREEYNKGISIKDIFRVSNVGITSGNDKFCFSTSNSQKSLQEFKQKILYFLTLNHEQAKKELDIKNDEKSSWQILRAKKDIETTNNNPNNYIKIHYRPFDYRWTYYTGKSMGFLGRTRGNVMKHFLRDTESNNMGLSIPRQLKDTRTGWNHCMTTQHITDQALTSGDNGAGVVHPLYLYNTESTQKNLKKGTKESLFDEEDMFQGKERIENFTPEFRSFIDSKYTWDLKDYEVNPHLFLDSKTLTPEAILGYIYAVLFHKDYREKYIDFLKIDFPKIPFVESKEKFLTLSNLGLELIEVHLMRERERERERTEINENESQYRASLATTNSKQRIQAHIHSTDNYGDVLYFKQNQRRQLPLSPLPLQHTKIKRVSMQINNIGLVCDRGCKLKQVDNIFVSQNIIDLHLVGSGSYIFPLYLYNKEA